MSERREEVTIPSGGSHLAGWLYRPEPEVDSGTCVVMAHGFSLTRHDGLDQFAQRFRGAGASVVVFDYRYVGDSGGQPRHRFRRGEQMDDWRAAIDFARRLPGVAGERVVLWGYSFSGGHCVYTAARDGAVAAVLLLCPFLDGLGRIRATPLSTLVWVAPRAALDLAGRHNTIPVTGPAGTPAAMSLPGEQEGFAAVAGGTGSRWVNQISPGVFLTVHTHRPWTKAAQLSMPVWVGMGVRDTSVPAVGILRLVRRAPDVQFRRYDADHFSVLTAPIGPQIAAAQARFLVEKGLVSSADG